MGNKLTTVFTNVIVHMTNNTENIMLLSPVLGNP